MKFKNHLHEVGRSNVMESGCLGYLKEDSMRRLLISMFLEF